MAMKGLLKQMNPWRRKTVAAGVEIFCLKCKERTASTNVEAVTMKNGRPATKAVCAVCGVGKYRVGSTPEASG